MMPLEPRHLRPIWVFPYSQMKAVEMKSVRWCLLAALFLLSQPYARAAGISEACTVAGDIYRDAALAEALRLAFDERHEWQGAAYKSLPESWKQVLSKDIEEFKPKLIPVVAATLKSVPQWNAEGLDGMAKARERILQGMGPISDLYVIRCIKMLQPQ